MFEFTRKLDQITNYAEARGKYEVAADLYRLLIDNSPDRGTAIAKSVDALAKQLTAEADDLSARAGGL